jgi:chemotaxis protein methyltransferase CheR
MPGRNQLDDARFSRLSAVVQRHLGLRLAGERRAVVETRLLKVMEELRIVSVDQLFDEHFSGADISHDLLARLADHVTTSHTHFHREAFQFDFFSRAALPEAMRRHVGDRDLRVWCAAAATGQEPYEIVMLMMEGLGLEYSRWKAGLLATDVSVRALGIARAGVYDATDVAKLSVARQKKFFHRGPDGRFAVSDALKSEITFRRLNLLDSRYPFSRSMDVVFCRNVIMYFDAPTQAQVLERIAQVMVPGGILFLGPTESPPRSGSRFARVEPGVFRLGA